MDLSAIGSIKCVVWDLDDTLWDGVLLEDPEVRLRPDAAVVIRTLDARGILHSIASRNDRAAAMQKLAEFGLDDYFVYPQINWNAKAASIHEIAKAINIGIDAIAFVDDQPFEREEVQFSFPGLLCIDAADVARIPGMPAMTCRVVTAEAKRRRLMLQRDQVRRTAEDAFVGPKEEFLATLGMTFTITRAVEGDLERVEELTVRTHQLNTTGYTYSYDELTGFLTSDRHLLLIAELDDKFGSYGKIGIALVECEERVWTIKLLLMSCRVMSRGVGAVLIGHVTRLALERGVALRVEFLPSPQNRHMLITLKFAGFKEVGQRAGPVILENTRAGVPPVPDYVRVCALE